MLDQIIAEIVKNQMKKVPSSEKRDHFWKFVEERKLEEETIETLFQKADFFITRTPQASFSESIYYDCSGYNYTQLNLSGRIGGIWIQETRYKEDTFPEDLDHGGEWKGSVEDWEKYLTLKDLLERIKQKKQKRLFRWVGESLIKTIEQHNFLQELEIKESEPRVCLYFIQEIENLMEHDSPVCGLTFDVMTRTREYKYFNSKEKALTFIGKRREQCQKDNSSLRCGKDYYGREGLVGKTNHYFAHELQIIHQVVPMIFPLNDLNKQHLGLLKEPRSGKVKEEVGYQPPL